MKKIKKPNCYHCLHWWMSTGKCAKEIDMMTPEFADVCRYYDELTTVEENEEDSVMADEKIIPALTGPNIVRIGGGSGNDYEILKSFFETSFQIATFTGPFFNDDPVIHSFWKGDIELSKTEEFEEDLTFANFLKDPKSFWERADVIVNDLRQMKPNGAHEALVLMKTSGMIDSVITQNTDLLHEDSGIEKVLHLHGSIANYICTSCKKDVPFKKLSAWFNSSNTVDVPPPCPECGAVLRPDIALIGEPIEDTSMKEAKKIIDGSDAVLGLGLDGSLYPSIELIDYALEKGKKVALLNKVPTSYDRRATAVIYQNPAEFFESFWLKYEEDAVAAIEDVVDEENVKERALMEIVGHA